MFFYLIKKSFLKIFKFNFYFSLSHNIYCFCHLHGLSEILASTILKTPERIRCKTLIKFFNYNRLNYKYL